MMNPGWKYWFATAYFAVLPLFLCEIAAADEVQLDRIDNAVRARLGRLDTQLAEQRWDEAVENLRQLADITDGGLVEAGPRRFVDLGQYCQMRLAALPPEALATYRKRADPIARQWYEQGVERRDRRMLSRIVDRAFASSYGDDALLALGDMDMESGEYASARWNWSRILPPETLSGATAISLNYPDSDIAPAAIRARLVLASILAGRPSQAQRELAQLARLYPDAEGRLGRRHGRYVEMLESLLRDSRSWPPVADTGWATFAGNPQRNKTADPLAEPGQVAWRHKLSADGKTPSIYPVLYRSATEDNRTILLFDNQREIFALRLDDGSPAWGRSAAIYRDESPEATGSPNNDIHPRTLTVFRDRLYARMGSAEQGYLVCLDLSAQGRLLWKIEPEEGWAFDGTPLADAYGVYVPMTRLGDARRQAFAAGLESDSGRIRWRRFVCGAENYTDLDSTHNLLSLAEGTIFFNTNLGAVAAIRMDDGRIRWLSLYPRETNAVSRAASVPNPCLFDGERLFAAPADSPHVFAFDAADGRLLWNTGADVRNVRDLLGAGESDLIVSGEKLYWVGVGDGRVRHVWPDDGGQAAFGRGLATEDAVLWPTRDDLHIFDRQTAKPLISLDLKMREAVSGNLLVMNDVLLIATACELIAIKCRVRETHRNR